MKIVVLGSAAGGGFPQWNCNSDLCQGVRNGTHSLKARTQSSIAVSANGKDFVLFNASPDLRQQVTDNKLLHPAKSIRDSPIRAVVLTNGDIDHIAGLLTMRERQKFYLYASGRVQKILYDNSIFQVLHPDIVTRKKFQLDKEVEICGPSGISLGLIVTPFAVPGKVPLFLEDEYDGEKTKTFEGDTIGLKIKQQSNDVCFFYIPGCAYVDDKLKERLKNAELILFDGTLFENEEMIKAGVGNKTGKRMGHTNMLGVDGSIEAFKGMSINRKIYTHINNTNLVLDENSKERKYVKNQGWEIAHDGMVLDL